MSDLKIKTAADDWGYPFGTDGVLGADETRELLGNISWSTLWRLADANRIRKGKMVGGQKTFYCKRSVMEYIESMEI